MQTWSKSLLSVYKYLETLCSAINNLILKNSNSSNYYCNGRYISAYSLANKVIALMDRKTNIINLKVIIEQGLNKLDDTSKRLLALSYIDNVSSKNLSELLGISKRTFFRKKNIAIYKFGLALKSIGYNDNKLVDMFGNERWLMNIYKSTKISEEKISPNFDLDNYDFNVYGKIIRELKFLNNHSFNKYV